VRRLGARDLFGGAPARFITRLGQKVPHSAISRVGKIPAGTEPVRPAWRDLWQLRWLSVSLIYASLYSLRNFVGY
jgi:hypothetical protein